MLTQPLVLDPVLVPKPWGGQRLHALGRPVDPDAAIGESWDVADLPGDATDVVDPVSRVRGGPHAGCSLADLLDLDRDGLLGSAARSPDGRFPLLVKVLDAAETLSVQVHPPASLDPARSKTESWVVLDAEPGAELLLGVREGVTLDQVRAAVGSEDFVALLQPVPVQAGDVIHVPAGTIHALGAGVLVAEVQTPSDTTHRLWDWPAQRDGGRELHVTPGMAAITAGWDHNRNVEVAPAADGTLVTTDAYTLQRWTLAAGDPLPASTKTGTARVCLVLAGGLQWEVGPGGRQGRRDRTECVLLPAASAVPLVATDDDTQVLVAVPS